MRGDYSVQYHRFPPATNCVEVQQSIVVEQNSRINVSMSFGKLCATHFILVASWVLTSWQYPYHNTSIMMQNFVKARFIMCRRKPKTFLNLKILLTKTVSIDLNLGCLHPVACVRSTPLTLSVHRF
jgi:hypothetical protein